MNRFVRYWMIVALFVLVSGFSTQCASRTVYIRTAPPAVLLEAKPVAPFAKAVWIPGHWVWRGNAYVWIAGNWVKPRAGHIYVPGHWVKKRRGWMWMEGHWKRQ